MFFPNGQKQADRAKKIHKVDRESPPQFISHNKDTFGSGVPQPPGIGDFYDHHVVIKSPLTSYTRPGVIDPPKCFRQVTKALAPPFNLPAPSMNSINLSTVSETSVWKWQTMSTKPFFMASQPTPM